MPIVIFIASFFTILYYLGVMQRVVQVFAVVMTKLLRISGAESLAGHRAAGDGHRRRSGLERQSAPGTVDRSCERGGGARRSGLRSAQARIRAARSRLRRAQPPVRPPGRLDGQAAPRRRGQARAALRDRPDGEVRHHLRSGARLGRLHRAPARRDQHGDDDAHDVLAVRGRRRGVRPRNLLGPDAVGGNPPDDGGARAPAGVRGPALRRAHPAEPAPSRAAGRRRRRWCSTPRPSRCTPSR